MYILILVHESVNDIWVYYRTYFLLRHASVWCVNYLTKIVKRLYINKAEKYMPMLLQFQFTFQRFLVAVLEFIRYKQLAGNWDKLWPT